MVRPDHTNLTLFNDLVQWSKCRKLNELAQTKRSLMAFLMSCKQMTYRIAGNFCGRKFSRFKVKSVLTNFCDFYFRDFKWTDLWISVGINDCGFYFRDSVYSPRNRENKNPAKISRYTVDDIIYDVTVRNVKLASQTCKQYAVNIYFLKY